jgi:peptide deformylase
MNQTLHIIRFPDRRLKLVSTPVTRFDQSLLSLATRMFELMRSHEGVGLAAPQVGHNLRMFVMNHENKPGFDRVVINPTLTMIDGTLDADEGCLSIPDVRVNVLRTDRVRLDAFDLDGSPYSLESSGFETRVWQHELDHLDGILLTDRMSFSEKMRHRKKLKLLEADYAKLKTKR